MIEVYFCFLFLLFHVLFQCKRIKNLHKSRKETEDAQNATEMILKNNNLTVSIFCSVHLCACISLRVCVCVCPCVIACVCVCVSAQH